MEQLPEAISLRSQQRSPSQYSRRTVTSYSTDAHNIVHSDSYTSLTGCTFIIRTVVRHPQEMYRLEKRLRFAYNDRQDH
jgi:hypothetical protein